MRLVITICCTIILFAAPVAAGILSIKAKMVVKIVDDNQTPIKGAQVTWSFRNYPSNTEIKCITDKDGVCVIEGDATNEGAIQVKKEGYYYSALHFEFEEENRIKGRYESWGEAYQVILKKKRNPIPMYAKRIHSMKVPIIDSSVGFDLEVGDWVAPHGEGIVNDFIFSMRSEETSWTEYSCSYTLNFTNEFDGIQEYYFDNKGMSIYKWPYNAPDNGYRKEITRTKSDSKKRGYQTTEKENVNYIFRVRTKLDEKGNIVEARYGKILGEIIHFPNKLQFTYYFNPDGTPNLEFDPEQNLFKFFRKERRKHRVKMP